MQIIDNRALLFDSPHAEQLTTVLDKSVVLEDGRVLARWDLKTAQTLVRLGYQQVPSAIAKTYAYGGRDPAMSHQRRMAEFMTLHRRCFNFSDMGTGKTRAVLWAVDYLMAIGAVKRALIVAPLSILHTAWQSDLYQTCMHRTSGIATGDAKRRAKLIDSQCEFVIINHDGIKSSRKELLKQEFDLIVIDEASAFSNTKTDRWKAMKSLLAHDPYLWLLTGTPAANSPLQAYGLAKLVCPDNVPPFFTGWRDLTMMKVSHFTYVPKPDARDMVFKALQPAIRFDKKDCLDLPAVTYVAREFDMDHQQQKYYDWMKREMLLYAADKQITAVNSGVLMGKLLQIASGTVYSDDGEVVDFRAQARLAEMMTVITESEHKVLVFAQYRHNLKTIAATLENAGIECAVIDGDTSPDARKLFINMFQNSDNLKVLVLQPKVAAHGVTLTRANVAIWFGPVASLELWRQANDRINRYGQVNKMTVVKLIGAPIERKVYAILERRNAAQHDLLELYRQELESSSALPLGA